MPTTRLETIIPILASSRDWPLHDAAASRVIEQRAQAALPPRTLMRRAGEAVARLALAIAPHARHIWVPCGPGNNGGDGLEAAVHLHRLGRKVTVTLLGDPVRLPADARDAHALAQAAGVPIQGHLQLTAAPDLVIDALLGLGASRAPSGTIAEAIDRINLSNAPRLAVDLPSGLQPDTGQPLGSAAVQAHHTLSLLTLKPGLFTGQGRDHCGEVWFDTLGIYDTGEAPQAWLGCASPVAPEPKHAHHKGSYGDVAVVGGALGMAGAAWLASRAAHAAGAGRVYVSLLDSGEMPLDPQRPELMVRPRWWTSASTSLQASTVVCGCGGGDAVREALPSLLSQAGRLVLDADALNAIAQDAALGTLLSRRAAANRPTVLTPHPLEAARLLACSTAQVQEDRLAAAQELANHLGCIVLLKGSGSVIAAPGRVPIVNPTGNALLATAGTGDVLAGWIGGLWARLAGTSLQDTEALAFDAVRRTTYRHGRCADLATAQGRPGPLRAADLIEAMYGAAG